MIISRFLYLIDLYNNYKLKKLKDEQIFNFIFAVRCDAISIL